MAVYYQENTDAKYTYYFQELITQTDSMYKGRKDGVIE